MIKPEEKEKLQKIFDDISENGILFGDKAREMMIQTGISVDILAKIWDMSDLDKDGSLNLNEFIISMYLINKAKIGALPLELPPEIFNSLSAVAKPLSPKDTINRTLLSPLKPRCNLYDSPQILFISLDMDKDGLVNGQDCKSIFLASGLPQLMLAHIWNICDVKQTGMLDLDHFVLAWFIINQKIKNSIDPPSQFYPELLELSKNYNPISSVDLNDDDYKQLQNGSELIDLLKEYEDLNKEKEHFEGKISLKEQDLKAKNEIYMETKKSVEILGEEVKVIETYKDKYQNKLDEMNVKEKNLITRVKDTQTQVEKLENEIKELNEIIATRSKVSNNNNNLLNPNSKNVYGSGKSIRYSDSVEDLIKQESEIRSRLASNNTKSQNQEQFSTTSLNFDKIGPNLSFGSAFDNDPFANQDTFGTRLKQKDAIAEQSDPFFA